MCMRGLTEVPHGRCYKYSVFGVNGKVLNVVKCLLEKQGMFASRKGGGCIVPGEGGS